MISHAILLFSAMFLKCRLLALRSVFALVMLLSFGSARNSFGAFGLTAAADYYTVDTGAGLVFKVRRTDNGVSTQSAGDLMSLVFNGVEYQNQARGSQINSGFDYLYNGVSAVSVTAAVVDLDYIRVTVVAGDLTHYYLARRGYPHIYMATRFATEPSTFNLCRFIVRIPSTLLPDSPMPSDIRNNVGAIEASDIFRMADGTTRSKHYSNMRLKDWSYIGATGPNAGVWMVRSNHEGDSGGPFYRSLLNQCGTDQEITYIINYGEAQTEAFRTNILNGPYALVFTTGGPPSALDMGWVANMGLSGFVGAAGRGAIASSGITGRDTTYEYTVGFANGQAQYWTDAAGSNGAFLMTGMLPGNYTLRVYKNELAVYTTSVTVLAGITNRLAALNISGDPSGARPLWRIGNWDGTPGEFLNGDKITTMHPSDVRMSHWNPGPYVVGVGSPDTGIPCYQWKDVNGSQVVQFQLTAGQLVASTVRVGITVAFEGARPKISVNAWSSSNPSPSEQPDTRTLTVGTYRGNNVTYTFAVPASALVAGNNTLTVYPISGSGGSGFLSAGYSLDCIDLYQGALQTVALPAAPSNLSATATNLQVALSWNAVAGANRYVVQRAIVSGGPYVTIATNLASTSFLDSRLPRGTCYYVVRAGNSSGTGTNSAELRVDAGIDIAPTLVPARAVWRYFDQTNDLGTSWRSTGFDDAAWKSGPARLGYGGDGEATTVANNRQWTTYFRRQFFIPNPRNVITLDGRITRDDAAVVYLNSVEIWRDTNITSGTVTFTTPALLALGGASETDWLPLNLPTTIPNVLVAGWNTLAAEVHNQNLDSSDIGFDFELTGEAIIEEWPEVAISHARGNLVLVWPLEASYFALDSTTSLAPPVTWTRLTSPVLLSNGVWTSTMPAAADGAAFFRLHLE